MMLGHTNQQPSHVHCVRIRQHTHRCTHDANTGTQAGRSLHTHADGRQAGSNTHMHTRSDCLPLTTHIHTRTDSHTAKQCQRGRANKRDKLTVAQQCWHARSQHTNYADLYICSNRQFILVVCHPGWCCIKSTLRMARNEQAHQ